MGAKYKGLKITSGRRKLHYLWAPLYILIWVLLYYLMTIVAQILPQPLKINDTTDTDAFIAERAIKNLRKLTDIGPRVLGTPENEMVAVQFLREEVDKIKAESSNNYLIETDVQIASGAYFLNSMVNMYQTVQNFVVKLTPRNSTSNSSLLINSHFDSVPGSPGGGDDGLMVVVMLEILRVLSKSTHPMRHSIIFLFNGAEENPLQASHAFITQHKWASNIKAFINLDSAGNGGREMLFQSTPSHSWLVKYYRDNVVYPYASATGEELFQHGFVPSDTDFRIFRKFGNIPGLDFAHIYNGYVYHTKYDRAEIIPAGTYQNTGSNILSIVKGLANAPELENSIADSDDYVVFYDCVGLFLVYYTEFVGMIINICVCIAAVVAICISMWCMTGSSGISLVGVLCRFGISFLLHLLGIIVGVALSILLAFVLDAVNLSLSWFSHQWLIFGLYFCPLYFGLAIVPAVYLIWTKENVLLLNHRVQLFLHSHCILLIILTLLGTGFHVRSAFLPMISVLFYTVTLCINLISTLHNKQLFWIIPHIVGQILPFLFYAYLTHTMFTAFIPMQGRIGTINNPEYFIAGASIAVGIFMAGFLIPVINMFRKPKVIAFSFLVVTVIFIILIVTPVGFPYRAETSPQRHWVFHTKRIFRDESENIVKNDSGYFLLKMDRRSVKTIEDKVLNISLGKAPYEDCKTQLYCGFPLTTHRMVPHVNYSMWIPAPDPQLIRTPRLRFLSKEKISDSTTRFSFELSGPDHMEIYIGPKSDVILTKLSFIDITNSSEWLKPPYYIHFSYGIDASPLVFSADFKALTKRNGSTFDMGIVGHLLHHDIHKTNEFKEFLDSFPDWTYVTAYMSSYESWIF